ncbi:MAG: glycosyltransferase [Verrucomicrobiota bacterium]
MESRARAWEPPETNNAAPVEVLEAHARPVARGKFIFVGQEKLYLRGVTYGPFPPDTSGLSFPDARRVEQDFSAMISHGVNAVRTYLPPPIWLLDLAGSMHLRVLVGLSWEQHVAFLSDRSRKRSIQKAVRDGVRQCAGHPALLGYAIGNEIPASIVRWHGRGAIERFLQQLAELARQEDPEALLTYVNYPTTEYLRLPFADLCCFNVFLESPRALAAYLARLQNLAGDRPLLLTELGLDSRRHGFAHQATAIDWQIRTAFNEGVAGTFVFAWTDEWHRGGQEITDWDFGLTTRDRQAKPSLIAACHAFAEVPFPERSRWPSISVIVCTYNGARTLRECLEALQNLDYPDYEVIVVNDGSTDATSEIAAEFEVRLVDTPNRGLSAARNTGLQAGKGEIVAYIDDDAYPDPHWLKYLATTFERSRHVAVGGPNFAPPGDGAIAECVVNAPGGPVHVLINDREAEHIPGCNMAFRKSALEEIRGFDAQFRVAGDDVDVCWRILERGWTIGFSPSAVVWHHRRNSIRAYWRQQQGYGKAEALLERKWPEKYNAVGHIQWSGRLYGRGLTRRLFKRQRVYHGPWGCAPFQTLHESSPSLLTILPTMPEWYLVIMASGGLSLLALLWPKLVVAVPVFIFVAGATLWQSLLSGWQAVFPSEPLPPPARFKLRLLTAAVHLLQPLARLWGRARHGLTAWRRHTHRARLFPVPRTFSYWVEMWHAPEVILQEIVRALRSERAVLVLGGEYDRWDIEVRGGLLGACRMRAMAEEHGAGRQLFRFRCWPRSSWQVLTAILVFTALAWGAAFDESWAAYDVLALVTLLLLGRTAFECACALGAIDRALKETFLRIQEAAPDRDFVLQFHHPQESPNQMNAATPVHSKSESS